MPREVIMPMLGMAQNTGLIVAWHKAPGDAVAPADVLLEVETDKSVMEVEAGFEGFVAEIRVDAGADVPVGEVIAVLSETPPTEPHGPADRPVQPAAMADTESAAVVTRLPAATPAPAPAPAPAPYVGTKPVPSAMPGRILASPKARRVARERGLDIKELAAHGVPQPYHVVDLDRLNAPRRAAGGATTSTVVARAARDGFAALMALLDSDDAEPVEQRAVLAAFAAASWRAVTDSPPEPLVVRAETAGAGLGAIVYADPDRAGLRRIAPGPANAVPALIMRDLTATRITSARLAGDAVVVVSVASATEPGYFDVALDFDERTLNAATAMAVVEEVARRIENPLLQIV